MTATSLDVLNDVKVVLQDVLQLGDRARSIDADTLLLGNIPELDSMSAAALMIAIEERFDVVVEENDVEAEIFDTVGSLSRFVERKIAG